MRPAHDDGCQLVFHQNDSAGKASLEGATRWPIQFQCPQWHESLYIYFLCEFCCKYTPTQLHSHDDLMNFKFLLNSFHWTQSMHLTLPQVSAFQKSCWKSPPAWRELRLQPATPWHGNWQCIDLSSETILDCWGIKLSFWHHLGANFHSTIQDCIFHLPRTPEPHCYHLLPSQRRNREEGKVGEKIMLLSNARYISVSEQEHP